MLHCVEREYGVAEDLVRRGKVHGFWTYQYFQLFTNIVTFSKSLLGLKLGFFFSKNQLVLLNYFPTSLGYGENQIRSYM